MVEIAPQRSSPSGVERIRIQVWYTFSHIKLEMCAYSISGSSRWIIMYVIASLVPFLFFFFFLEKEMAWIVWAHMQYGRWPRISWNRGHTGPAKKVDVSSWWSAMWSSIGRPFDVADLVHTSPVTMNIFFVLDNSTTASVPLSRRNHLNHVAPLPCLSRFISSIARASPLFLVYIFCQDAWSEWLLEWFQLFTRNISFVANFVDSSRLEL